MKRISLLIKIVNNVFERELNNKISEIGLTVSQCDVLGYINHNSAVEVNPVDIEKFCNMSRPTVTGILKRLKEKEFINFKESSKDKRYKQIVCTQKAEMCREIMRSNISDMEKVLLNGISQEQQNEISELLKTMLKNMKK